MARVTSRVESRDHFDRVTAAVERKVLNALDRASEAALAEARRQQKDVDFGWEVKHARGDFNGFSSGIRARNRLVNVFDHGSLGARGGRKLVAAGRRKASWTVKQKHRTYEAHRHSEALTDAKKGIKSRNITNPARTAGRRRLLAELRR